MVSRHRTPFITLVLTALVHVTACKGGSRNLISSADTETAPDSGEERDASDVDIDTDSDSDTDAETVSDTDACVPTTCDELGPERVCGAVPDACGGTLDLVGTCGRAGCDVDARCTAENTCEPICVPLTCESFADADCGVVPDGCGGDLDLIADCGAPGCSGSQTCMATSGVPASYALTCVDLCPIRTDCENYPLASNECGAFSDDCGGTVDMVADCGAVGCTGTEQCAPGRFGFLECGTASCTPLTCGDFPDLVCGSVSDGCGDVLDLESSCGAPGCTAPERCGGGHVGPNRCGDPACWTEARTCERFSALIADAVAAGEPLCGVFDDGCGGTVDLVADCGAPGCLGCTAGDGPPPHCDEDPVSALDARLCFEHATGCPGEVVELDVHVLLWSSCAVQGTGQRSAALDLAGLALWTPRDEACGVERCVRRHSFGGRLDWSQFGAAGIGCSTRQCPEVLPGGHVDRLMLRIPADAIPGDLVLSPQASFIANPCDACPDDSCEATGTVMPPTVRVAGP